MMRLPWAITLLLALAGSAAAKPGYKPALADHMGPFLPKRVGDCKLCHVRADANGRDPERNPFGKRLEEVRREYRKAGKSFDLPIRLAAVEDEDADGDGAPNLIEILSGHFPGDPADKPTAAEVAAARGKLPAYRRFLAAYPWQPLDAITKRPTVPRVQNTGWILNPIDAFVVDGHEAKELTPRPEADRETLLRRVTLDLTGQPPTPEDLRTFLADPAADAYEKAVDRLLASPRYGERWGSYWATVWAAAGRDDRAWRDWIVESLNADKGYDRMIVEMLAGGDADLRATGYLARDREGWVPEVIDRTFLAFQAMSIGCARCHDHPTDQFRWQDYARLRAVFEPAKVAPGAPATYGPDLPEITSAGDVGRRVALAKWLTDPANPLTTRVAVNHIWLVHFGQALVPTVYDFGKNARRPTHPALLDWLAAELTDKKWSMKHLHRLIVTSRTYRQAATADPASAARDPDNSYLWRFPPDRPAPAAPPRLQCAR